MVFTFWGAKGGVGTSVVALACALGLAEHNTTGVLLVDAAGDLPAMLGLAEPTSPGITDWLSTTVDLPTDALWRLSVPVRPGLDLLPLGNSQEVQPERVELLSALLASDDRDVVIDAGMVGPYSWPLPMATMATRSIVVLRPCYLALRKAVVAPVRVDGAVLVTEVGRALNHHDVESVLGVPVLAQIPQHPAIARAVDTGLLGQRVPRVLKDTWEALV